MPKSQEAKEFAVVAEVLQQVNRTKVWVDDHRKNNDTASMRNAAFALGKLAGLYQAAVHAVESMPAEVTEAVDQLAAEWGTL